MRTVKAVPVQGRPSQPPPSTPGESLGTTLDYTLNNLQLIEDHVTTIESELHGPSPADAPSQPIISGLADKIEITLKRLQRVNDRLAVIAQTL